MPIFAELARLQNLRKRVGELGEVREYGVLDYEGQSFPILSFHFGVKDATAPTLIFVAGVHGLEKIGTQVLSSFLESWLNLLRWDKTLKKMLKTTRVIFYPIVNPVGMYLNRRSNGNGVDLMRNAPGENSDEALPLVGGHRISALLPWYRGENGLEYEAQVLQRFIHENCFQGGSSIVLDIHSGFGLKDSLWFPYAAHSRYYSEAPRIMAIKRLLDKSYPHHTYTIEPQHFSYMASGDLWDYFLDEHKAAGVPGLFLPLCLEMGSWTWVRKNPRQIFSRLGLFNPMLPHRVMRAERRHFILFNFLLKLVASPEAWVKVPKDRMHILEKHARRAWYPEVQAT
ncbi:MAG: DUF2817 domain-containing protein [Proteobacteria bacterium]|nr:MAG: DUF2817 domain-containing protein [Pseudomonadota bacterium]